VDVGDLRLDQENGLAADDDLRMGTAHGASGNSTRGLSQTARRTLRGGTAHVGAETS
jgi:hypothetical protein